MSQLTFRHDYYFKRFFQILELVLEHVRDYLPPELVQWMDLNTFTLDTTNYAGNMSETRSDLTYRCDLLTDAKLELILLDEHKSEQPDYDIRTQILPYKCGIWRNDEGQKQPLTFVLPSVIYHGKKDWVKQPFNAAFPGLPPSFLPFLAEFDYLLTNLRSLTDAEIERRSPGKMLRSAFLAFRHAFEPDYLKQNFAKVVNFDWQNYSGNIRQRFLRDLVNYVASLGNFKNRQEFERAAKPLPGELNYFAMMTIESIFEEGRAIGKEEGMEKGMEKGMELEAERKQRQFVTSLLTNFPTWTDDKIADLAGTTKTFVAKIRKELEAKNNGNKAN